MTSTKSHPNQRRGFLAATSFFCLVSVLPAANYQDAVFRLEPSYYYQLNETSTAGGAVDSVGTALPGMFNGDYANGSPAVGGPGPLVVFNPDDFDGTPVPGVGGDLNLAHYSNNEGHVTLGAGTSYGANAMSIAFFFKAGPAEGGDRIFTNNVTDATKSFQVNTANDGLVLSVDPNSSGLPAERTLFMEDNSGPDRRLIQSESGWFHVIATTSGATGTERAANCKLWINGVDRTDNLMPNETGWGTDTGLAKIGGRRAAATDSTTHSGAQDEVAIWLDRVLTDAEAESLWEAAINEKFVPLIITDVQLSEDEAGKTVSITWDSRPGKTYAVFATDSFTGEWTELSDGELSQGDSTVYQETGIPAGTERRFYRVEEGVQ